MPKPAANPLTKWVFPAPRSPSRQIISPGESSLAICLPKVMVSAGALLTNSYCLGIAILIKLQHRLWAQSVDGHIQFFHSCSAMQKGIAIAVLISVLVCRINEIVFGSGN